MVQRRFGTATVELVRGDITQLDVEAFVYDITEDGKLGTGLGSAIQQRGGVAIQKQLDAIGGVATGDAVVTEAGLLPADWIIHANGPKFREEHEDLKLQRATSSALARAEEKGIRRLAIPPIGTGIYQVPLDLCARVMVETIANHLSNGSKIEKVLLVAPDPREFEPFRAELEKEA